MSNRRLLSAALALGVVLASAWPMTTGHAEETLSAGQKTAVEALIKDYLLEHPEIIVQAMEKLRENQRKLQAVAEQKALKLHKAALRDDPESPVGGNPNGDVVVVEFFDYQCGVCKRVYPVVKELLAKDRNVRLVYKEWPILGAASTLAAKAALASRAQGKYAALHDELMRNREGLTSASLISIAEKVGLDTKRLTRDMQDPRLDQLIKQNYALADALNLNGTPSFIVGDTVLRGGRDYQTIQALVDAARKANKAQN